MSARERLTEALRLKDSATGLFKVRFFFGVPRVKKVLLCHARDHAHTQTLTLTFLPLNHYKPKQKQICAQQEQRFAEAARGYMEAAAYLENLSDAVDEEEEGEAMDEGAKGGGVAGEAGALAVTLECNAALAYLKAQAWAEAAQHAGAALKKEAVRVVWCVVCLSVCVSVCLSVCLYMHTLDSTFLSTRE